MVPLQAVRTIARMPAMAQTRVAGVARRGQCAGRFGRQVRMSVAIQQSSRTPSFTAEVRATAALAAPLIVGKLAGVGQNVVDVLLAGHLNAHVLAAVAVGSAIWILAFMAASGIAYALPPAVAQLDGAGRRAETGKLLAQALRLGAVAGLVLLAAVRWGAPELVRLAGTAPSLLPDVTLFLHAVSFGAPALTLLLICMGFSEGLSMPRPSMAIGILGLLVLAPVGYVLMYGRLGLPSLGAQGSGIAAAFVTWVELAAMAGWLAWSGRYRGTGWERRRRGTDWRAIRGLLGLGAPIAVSQLLESTLFASAALVISRFGETQAASHQIAMNVASTTFMVPLGLAYAITVRVGNAVGRRDPAGVRRAGFVGISMALTAQVLSASALLLLPRFIAGLFTVDLPVVAGAAVLLQLAGAFQLSDGMQVSAMGALRGLKDTRVPMLITGVSYLGRGHDFGRVSGAAPWLGRCRHVVRARCGPEQCRRTAVRPVLAAESQDVTIQDITVTTP